MPLVDWPLPVVAVVNVAAWATFHTVTGLAAHLTPDERLQDDGPVLRLRRIERQGRVYERFGVRRWKDRLPEAGALLPGGTSKRHLLGHSPEALRRYAAETRRAERGHWLAIACGPLALLWNPPGGAAAMVAYGAVVNAPFIVIQRYNRGRLLRVLERSSAAAEAGRVGRRTNGSNIP